MSSIEIRELKSISEQSAGRAIFDITWPMANGGTEVTPNLMQAFVHNGAYFVGAYDGVKIIGATFGFIGTSGGIHLHSHMSAVLAEHRGRGVGALMKRHQFEWCHNLQIPFITWTFDPLVKRNAKLNILKLGVEVSSYHPNFYGVMPDLINAGDDSDRLMVKWLVSKTLPAQRKLTENISADAIAISIPEDIVELRVQNLTVAKAARIKVREEFQKAFANGFRVVGFSDAAGYVLSRGKS